MRLLQIGVPVGQREAVVGVLEDAEVEFALVDEVGGEYSTVAFVPIRAVAVEALIDELRAVDVQRHGYVAVTDLDAILSDKFERLSVDRQAKLTVGAEISDEELAARARNLVEDVADYLILIVVSAVVATAGILTNSTAVVVGSMVIAPVVGPSLAASVGTVLEDGDLFRVGVKDQLLGLGAAIASATAFALVVRYALHPGIDVRFVELIDRWLPPGALSLVIALGSGIAGGLSLTSGTSATLVGVMIAAALIPPAATIGLGIAYADVTVTVGAAVLLLANVLSINLTSLGVFWMQGYRPSMSLREADARRATLKRTALLLVGIAVVSSFLVVTTLNVSDNATFENQVDDVLREETARVLSVDVSYTTDLFFQEPDAVTVRIADESPPDEDYLRRRIRDATGEDVTVVLIVENARVSRESPTTDSLASIVYLSHGHL